MDFKSQSLIFSYERARNHYNVVDIVLQIATFGNIGTDWSTSTVEKNSISCIWKYKVAVAFSETTTIICKRKVII